jgi:hypothetical protein
VPLARRGVRRPPGSNKLLAAIGKEYEAGRTTRLSNSELDVLVKERLPEPADCELGRCP